MPTPTTDIYKILSLCILLVISFSVSAQTNKVDELLNQLNNNNPDTTQIRILRKISAAYSAVDPVKKFYYANQYKLLAEKNNIDSSIANAYLDMGISYGIRSNLDSALHYFKLGYEKAKSSNYVLGVARSQSNIGFAYDRLDRKDLAVKNYEEALKVYRKLNIKKAINQNITNLGSLYYDLGEYEVADTYFQQVLMNVKEIPSDEIGLGNALFSLGNSNRKLGNPKKSIAYYRESLAIREKIGDLNGIALSNWGIANLLIDKKEYRKAMTPLNIALKNNRILKNIYHECAVLISLSRAHLGLKNYEKAEQTANLALSRAKETGSKVPVSETLELLVEINKEQKKYHEALKFQSDYIAINDSINTTETRKNVVINDLHRINSDNKSLQRDNNSITSKNAQYIKTISIITAVLIVVALLLVLYYQRNSEKKASNILLQNQQKEITEANEELAVLNDELKAQMDLISTQNIELEKLNMVKNKFFSIVSHDLRSPLNTLKMLFQMYREGVLTEEELNDLLYRLEDTIHTTANFLDNLLEWSKNQLEGIAVNPSEVNIQQIVAYNIKLMDSQIKNKELKVANNIQSEMSVFADQDMINVVIRNLLSNAIKFCNPQDQIIFDAEVVGSDVVFSISDSGPGISDENKSKLFDLSHTTSTGTSGEKGYHIGLILCKDMVAQNKGGIRVESTLNAGTSFYINLPKYDHSISIQTGQ